MKVQFNITVYPYFTAPPKNPWVYKEVLLVLSGTVNRCSRRFVIGVLRSKIVQDVLILKGCNTKQYNATHSGLRLLERSITIIE